MIDPMHTDTMIQTIKRQITERKVTLAIPGMDDATHGVLYAAFNQICGREDWKGPINAVVPIPLVGLYAEAIRFFTATEPVQLPEDSKHVRLISVGYHAGPAGDH
jgi:hypothetical protein